ncbi:transcriptional regulator FilR1 domain-containing protein [Haladaptatus caseinilyticus]|uniref:transcriptional regulator FilR1 domain-containing protein n=1 Tax=Haladaptatus caseinilyticus TaxID=2993314 RepID=UPI00224B7918|nr:helix-turn-helix domain-containing protein [Haladaptatus caseinilyticus]
MTATARNPLTEEELEIRTVINETVDSVRLDILCAFKQLPSTTTSTNLATHADVSRQAVSQHLGTLHDRGFVNRDNKGAELTAGGLLFVEAINDCLQNASVEGLSYLTRSVHPLVLLEELSKQAYRLSELQTAASNLPSQSTIRRILSGFVDHGWITDDSGTYRITPTGNNALSAYRELVAVVEQLIKKAPWLQRLPIEAATFPLSTLTSAELVVSNPRSPASVLSTCLKLYDRNISQFRCLCSVYNPVLFQAYRGLFELGVDSEAILDWPTAMKAADNSATRYSVQNERYSNYQSFVLEESHTLGIGIYDDRRVAIGAYNESGTGNHIAMIVSSNDRLVEWGIDLYESYRADATPATEVDLSRL